MKRLVAISLLLVALASPSPAHADITIGFIAPLTGKCASIGEQMKHGAEQAVVDINAAGGVLGEKLALYQADDACDPKQAVSVANKMASQGLKFVIGPASSGAAIPASKVFMDEGMLMISPVATNPKLTDEAKDLIFRNCGRDDQQGVTLGKYALKHFKDKKIAVLHDNSAYGLGITEVIRKTLNEGGAHEVIFEAFTPGERDYSALISKLKRAGVQVAMIGGYQVEVGLIARQIKDQGATIQIIGGDALVTNEFWSVTGAAGEGVLMSFNPDPRKRPEAKAAIEAIRKGGYEPEGYTLYTYAAVQTLAEGIKQGGKTDPMKVASVLRSTTIPTVIGSLRFDAKGDVTGQTYVVYRWHEGTYEEVGE